MRLGKYDCVCVCGCVRLCVCLWLCVVVSEGVCCRSVEVILSYVWLCAEGVAECGVVGSVRYVWCVSRRGLCAVCVGCLVCVVCVWSLS